MENEVISSSRNIAHPRKFLYDIIADYKRYHGHILPKPPFDQLIVDSGGYGDGTVIRFNMKLGPIVTWMHAKITEEKPGFLLHENDVKEVFRTSFKFEEMGDLTRVTISMALLKNSVFLRTIFRAVFRNRLISVFEQELFILEKFASRGSL